MGSTKIFSASCVLMPRRTLHTWQMIFACCESNRTFCSSQKPISRSRCLTSGGAESCLIRTEVPARTWLKGQTNGCGHSAFASTRIEPSFIGKDTRRIETQLQERTTHFLPFSCQKGPLFCYIAYAAMTSADEPLVFGSFRRKSRTNKIT